MHEKLDALEKQLPDIVLADRRAFRRRLGGLRRRLKAGKPIDRGLSALGRDLTASVARVEARTAALPQPDYPAELPVSDKRVRIAAAIEEHQVVVIAGETGSGKTTQLPKICLELGRGVRGMIAHTQPRRLAARSVASRIASELKSPLGEAVGYKVRFSDRVGENTYVKLLTDGMLLAEIQSDPLLEQYDTVIIDEAHERSLNIDFLLGYLKELLPKRPDLKVIVTSATINTESFSRFFGGAPVIEVSGRTYPVEVRYRPLAGDEDERDRDQTEAIIDAVDELAREDPLGDILVFLSGEREIRETAEALHKHKMRDTEVLPLFSRLSAAEQDRIFAPHGGRRIILSTNVAETSLTVPGIRFVVDPGYARISRYSVRTKVQRLPIEPVSQASANQRAGRCGRVSAGVCIRLYSEEDFVGRPEFTDPEIRRTDLASVILQMSALGIGDVASFPFMDSPERRLINDGFRVLHELGAVDEGRALTGLGRKLARLPVDPRIGRMLLAADREGSVREVLIIASALAIQDPRERPLDAQQKADELQRKWRDEESDFAAYLKLWDDYHEQARHLSRNKLRRWCKAHFLSYLRMREWHDIHSQLLTLAREFRLRLNEEPAEYGPIHRAILTGLLSNAAVKSEAREYIGARNIKLALFPGSGLFKKSPKWIMAAELVETTRLFARTAATIKPAWLEQLAGHLLKRTYLEPHWEKKPAQVAAFEQATLYGLLVVPRRKVNYGPIDPVTSREFFIRHALVRREYRTEAAFFRHNRELVESIESLEAKVRRRDVLVDEEVLFDFYDELVPGGIYSGKAFEKWRADVEKENPRLLYLTREELMRRGAEEVTGEEFPDHIALDGLRLPLEYHFEPGHPEDGVTAVVPLPALGQLRHERFDWLVPGLREEKLIGLIKSLPKSLRRNFVPAVNFARAALQALEPEQGPMTQALARHLKRMTGVEVPDSEWAPESLPPHLQMNFRVVDQKGAVLARGRDLERLQRELADSARGTAAGHPFADWERDGLNAWDFGELPERVEGRSAGLKLQGFPGLVDAGDSVALRVFDRAEQAEAASREGTLRLYMLQLPDKVKYLRKSLPDMKQMCLHYSPVGKCEQLGLDLAATVFRDVFINDDPLPRTRGAYIERLESGKGELVQRGTELAARVREALSEYHQLARLIKGSVPPQHLQAVAEVRAQLESLIYPGFVAVTPPQRLKDLARYIRAARLRIEKLNRSPERDRQLSAEVRRLFEPFAGQYPGPGRADPQLEDFRWRLEELRVSLFAQELGTSEPVSAKRLEKRWREMGR